MKKFSSSRSLALGAKRLQVLVCLVGGGLLLSNYPVRAQTRNWPEFYKTQRAQYIEVTQTLRSPNAKQKQEIPRLYRLFSEIEETRTFGYSGVIYLRARLPKEADRLSPEELADYISKSGGGDQYLSVEAKANGRKVLQTNLEAVQPLIENDLRSGNPRFIERGLNTLQEMADDELGLRDTTNIPLNKWLDTFYEDAVSILEHNPALEQKAVRTLVVLNDPRAIKLFITRDPGHPTRYYEELQSLSKIDPRNPALLGLVPLLDSPDHQRRYEALWALSRTDKSILLPHVRLLLKDSDAQVRWLAASSAFSSGSEGFTQLKPQLLKMLNDPDEFVRYVTASGFVQKNDVVAAPTLLRILKGQTASLSIKGAVIEDVRRLTGERFGYEEDGSVPPQENIVKGNQLALSKFEKWIQEHPAKTSTK